MVDKKTTFAEKIKKIQDKLEINQKELAERLGISQIGISNYKKGKREPDINTIQKLIDFGISPLFLFSDFPEPFDEKYNDFLKTYKKQITQDEIIKKELELGLLKAQKEKLCI